MSNFYEIQSPQEQELLISFFDLLAFAKTCEKLSSREIFDVLSEYYEFAGEIVEGAGGKIVKFIGDAGLAVFPPDKIDEGVLALKKLQEEAGDWFATRHIKTRNIVSVHFGPVACGPMGTKGDKQFDIIGVSANIAARLQSNGFAMSPQVFRKLKPETRKHFKKHTPPITYIPVEEHHRD